MSRFEALRRGLLRPTAFRLGLASGVGVFLMGWLLVYLTILGPNPEPKFNVEVVSSGAALDRNGGREIAVRNDSLGFVFTATCNDACDDIWYRRQSGGDASYEAQVLDAARRCIACGGGAYVTSGLMTGVNRWTFAGSGRLVAEPTYYHLERDGTLSR